MGVRELVGDSKGVPASEKVKDHCFKIGAEFNELTFSGDRLPNCVNEVVVKEANILHEVAHL